jgi:hypothetical protein
MNVRVASAMSASGYSRSVEGDLDGDIFSVFSEVYEREKREAMSLADYLAACRDDAGMYATAA